MPGTVMCYDVPEAHLPGFRLSGFCGKTSVFTLTNHLTSPSVKVSGSIASEGSAGTER